MLTITSARPSSGGGPPSRPSDPTPGGLHQHDAGGDVPGPQRVALDHAVQPATGDVGHDQGRCTEQDAAAGAVQGDHPAAERGDRRGSSFWMPVRRQRASSAVVDTAVAAGRPSLGGEALVPQWVVDDAGQQRAGRLLTATDTQ